MALGEVSKEIVLIKIRKVLEKMTHLYYYDGEVKMRQKEKTLIISPFLAGISSTFDLLGVNGLSLDDIKKRNRRRLEKNSIKHDFLYVGKILKRAIEQYEQEIRHSL